MPNINTPEYWNKKYKKIGGRWGEKAYYFLKDQLNQNDSTVLDIGCGRGAGIKWLSENYLDNKYVGIDFSVVAVNAANSRKIPNAKFFIADCYKFDPVGDYDYILMIELLEHLRWPNRVIAHYLDKANKAIFISIPSHQWKCNEHVYAYDNVKNPFKEFGAELILTDSGRSKFIIRR